MDSEFVCNLEGYRPQYSFKILNHGNFAKRLKDAKCFLNSL